MCFSFPRKEHDKSILKGIKNLNVLEFDQLDLLFVKNLNAYERQALKASLQESISADNRKIIRQYYLQEGDNIEPGWVKIIESTPKRAQTLGLFFFPKQ